MFSRAHDTQVTVYFRWEGAPGPHRLGAMWRSPGGSSSTNAFDYQASDRVFGAYWTLPLSTATPLGKWSIDATVDGLPCGNTVFEVADADARPAAAARRPLAPGELFERIQAAFAVLERGASRRGQSDVAAAVLVQPGMLATTFGAIDAADTLYATVGKGPRRELTTVAAWSRQQDWALLPVAHEGSPLPIATSDATAGDRCFSLQAGAANARLLAEGTITGRADGPSGGARLIVSFTIGDAVPGAPVVNEYGELVGLVSAGLTPGLTTLRDRLRSMADLHGAPVVPASMLSGTLPAPPSTLRDLRARGITMTAVIGEDSVLDAGFAHEAPRSGRIDGRREFSTTDKKLYAFVVWDPKDRIRGAMKLAMYDEDNRLVAESKTSKADFRPGSSTTTRWQVPVPARPGTYHADVIVGDATMCRRFVTVR